MTISTSSAIRVSLMVLAQGSILIESRTGCIRRRRTQPTDVPDRIGGPNLSATRSLGERRVLAEPRLTARDVVSASEIAQFLGVPVSTVHHWAREGMIPSRKIGRRRGVWPLATARKCWV
jgi:excisionase family DNA binding protein